MPQKYSKLVPSIESQRDEIVSDGSQKTEDEERWAALGVKSTRERKASAKPENHEGPDADKERPFIKGKAH